MPVRISVSHLAPYTVILAIDHQSFNIIVPEPTRARARWYAKQLRTAMARVGNGTTTDPETMTISVVQVMKFCTGVQLASANKDWREAADCLREMVENYAARLAGVADEEE